MGYRSNGLGRGSLALVLNVVLLCVANVPGAEVLDFYVIHQVTKKPMPDVELKIRITRERSQAQTDQQGRCRIALGETTPDDLRIEARKKGFVPLVVSWRPARDHTEIPDHYTLALEAGTRIGGIVQNEQGEPIVGATVFLLVPGSNEIERAAIWDHQETTDDQGRWQCGIMPANLEDVWLRLSHPDYTDDARYGSTPKPPMEKLRDMTGVMTMKRGLTVSGRVLDKNGRAIAGASVAQGSDRHGSSYPSTKTDQEGRFVFKNAKPGQMILTVQAKGHAPDLEELNVHKAMKPIEFRLGPGQTIKGQIVDTAGKPIAGAFVAADTWRSHRSIMWRVDTDAQGRFQWNDAPADEVLVDMGKQHYMSVRNFAMCASPQDYIITMPPELKVQGKVTDADTGQPIAQFKVLPGIDWGGGRETSWQRRSAKTFSNGNYTVTFTFPRPGHFIRVEAEGCEPGISRAFMSDEGAVSFDFKLAKGEGPAGNIHLPDGSSAAGAEVILCTPSLGATIRNGRNIQKRESLFVETKADGRFAFAAQTDPYLLIVLHERGYARITQEDLNASAEVTLQPWACIQGKLLIGNKPGANETLRLGFDAPYERSTPRLHYDYRAQTDEQGAFEFKRVPAGKVRVSREIRVSERMTRFSHSINREVKAGETVIVVLGGTGRPVVGRIIIPEVIEDQFDWQYLDYRLSIDSPENPYQQLGGKFNPNGTFCFDDVPAGRYCLTLNAYGPPANARSFRGEPIGILTCPFTVLEMPSGRSDEPLDLGALELQPIGVFTRTPRLEGKPLPSLEGIHIDFTPQLALDKRILICFFDMQQRPSRHLLSQLVQQAGQLQEKGVSVIAVQGAAFDENKLKEWVKENGVSFPVGVVQGDEEKIRSAWGVKSLPWLILTDKEHVIQAEGLTIAELGAKLP